MTAGSNSEDRGPGGAQAPAQRRAERPEGARDPRQQTRPDDRVPPAGTHATPELTDPDKTPGAGALPDQTHGEADPGSE